jgi:hypothetical protein
MKVTVEVDLAPFNVPDTVAVKGNAGLKQNGFVESRSMHLSELGAETLSGLCEEFKDAVFAKAGKGSRSRQQELNKILGELIKDLSEDPWLLDEPTLEPLVGRLKKLVFCEPPTKPKHDDLYDAIKMAREGLPHGFTITLSIQRGSAMIKLEHPNGDFKDDFDNDTLCADIVEAFEIAIKTITVGE